MAGVKGRSGPPKGSMNALKNGSRLNSRRKRLTVGELPAKMIACKREGRKYRRGLETEVMEIKGEINTLDAHLIDTASAATIQSAVCRWLLRHKLDTMNTSDIRGCMQDIVKSKTIRDKAVNLLQLDAPAPDPWLVVDGNIPDEH